MPVKTFISKYCIRNFMFLDKTYLMMNYSLQLSPKYIKFTIYTFSHFACLALPSIYFKENLLKNLIKVY